MRIVATLTTLPNRYNKLIRCLKNLHQQTIPLNTIYVTIPKVAKRLNQTYPPIPKELSDLCTIVRTETDYGPLTKLYGALKCENDPNTVIFSFDDDALYDTQLVESLLNKSKIQPNAAICGTGWLLKHGTFFFSMKTSVDKMTQFNSFIGVPVPETGRAIDCIQGTAGVLYKRGFFPKGKKLEKFLNLAFVDDDLFKNDDVVISAYLCSQGIKRYTFNDIPLTTNYDADADALSYDAFKMLESFSRAVNTCTKLHLFKEFEYAEVADSPSFKIIMLAVFVIVVAIVILGIVFNNY